MRPHTFRATQCGFDCFLVKDGGVNIRRILQLEPGNLLSYEMLDFLHVGELFGRHNGKGIADILRATRAPNPVHIIFRMLRDVIVDYVAYSCNVNATRGDICGNHHFVASVLESFQRLNAFWLVRFECKTATE